MDCEPYDSSGTDDDLPPSHRSHRRAQVSANGRPSVPSAAYPRMPGETEMETQIHQLEMEAYISILRAFKAQADAITWEKESLITELRKELRLSNEEHRELLAQVNADDTIRGIREWRQSSGAQYGMLNVGQAVDDAVASPTVSASLKKQKPKQSMASPSFGGPSSSLHVQAGRVRQPSSSIDERGSVRISKGKKHKPGWPGSSSIKNKPYQPSNETRSQVVKRISSGSALLFEPNAGAASDPLIGRRVRTRWPDDNTFYEAVITEHNPVDGRHALVYDIGTASETWEWVNLSEISPEDIVWIGEDPGISHRHSYDGLGHRFSRSVGPNSLQKGGRGLAKNPIKKEFRTSQNAVGKKTSHDIRIRHTGSLIKDVERVFGGHHSDPLEIEKAKRLLEEHEQALLNAIARLADVSDGESEGSFHQ